MDESIYNWGHKSSVALRHPTCMYKQITVKVFKKYINHLLKGNKKIYKTTLDHPN